MENIFCVARVIEIKGLSAHGDQKDLLNWLSDLKVSLQSFYCSW
jgi:hypothetical protein